MKTVVMGCDNAAVGLKNLLAEFLRGRGVAVEDMGCDGPEDTTHYPAVAARVCERIIGSGYEKKGVLVCGTGIGMSIAANKFRGIRAALCHDSYSAERSVLSNDANVLCMGGRVIGPELAKKIAAEWIGLEYRDGPSTPKLREIARLEEVTMK